MDRDDIRVVAEDLQYLSTAFGPDIPDPDIRRGSAVLRRLLVEGIYGRAWRAVGLQKQPSVIAVDLDQLLGADTERVVCAMAWGANFRGMYMASPVLGTGAGLSETRTPQLRKDGFPGERLYALTEFMESTSGVANQVRVVRREIVKYVANVKGGVHLGSKARSDEKDLIRKLEKFEKRMAVNMTDGILVEVVAIAQAVATSDDTKRFLQMFQST